MTASTSKPKKVTSRKTTAEKATSKKVDSAETSNVKFLRKTQPVYWTRSQVKAAQKSKKATSKKIAAEKKVNSANVNRQRKCTAPPRTPLVSVTYDVKDCEEVYFTNKTISDEDLACVDNSFDYLELASEFMEDYTSTGRVWLY